MSSIKVNNITNESGTSGPVISGITTVNSSGFMRVPVGSTGRRLVSDFVPNNIIDDGLVLYLDAGNSASYSGSGTTWTDLSGQGNNGTLVNGVGYTVDDGGSLIFDGVNDYCFINVDDWIRTKSSSYTFNSLFYYNDSTNGGSVFSLLNSPNSDNLSDGFWQHLNLNGSWLWRTEDIVSGEINGTTQAPSQFLNGNWYYLSIVVKTNSLIFYVNGNLINTASPNFSWANLRTDRPAYLYVGSGYGDGYPMKGKIINFQMYDRELTIQEVSQNFNALRYRFGV